MFLWSARTLADALREHLPKTAHMLEQIAAAFGTRKFAATFRKSVSQVRKHQRGLCRCSSRARRRASSIATSSACPADFGWNDLGSWTALHEHHTAKSSPAGMGTWSSGSGVCLMNARGNYVHAPGKFVAAVGVNDLVVVETPDALLITTRENAQDVGKVVKYLDEKNEKLV